MSQNTYSEKVFADTRKKQCFDTAGQSSSVDTESVHFFADTERTNAITESIKSNTTLDTDATGDSYKPVPEAATHPYRVLEVKEALAIVMHMLLVFVLVAYVVESRAIPTHICPRGTHLLKVMPGLEVCPLCQDGVTYMTHHWHTHPECFNCTRLIDPAVELLVTECNITHDTVIHCRSGFYRRLAKHQHQSDQCVKCSECENPTRLCEGLHDTVCCGLPSYEAVLDNDNVYICKEKPIVCTQGQYYSPHYEQCFPCPPDTYMSEDSHNNKECKLCQKVGNNSSRLLLQACNSTHPAIGDCKPGWFRHSPQESPLTDDDCSPCQTCQFVGRECTRDHDTVCCDTPEMTVVDNNTRPVCVSLSDTNASSNTNNNTEGLKGKPTTSEHITVCGQNEFINISNDPLTCQRCREGTYNDDLNHNRTSCQDCSEFSGRQLPVNCRTGNDVFKNTDSGMSINRIVLLVSTIFAVLVLVAYFILKWRKRHNKERITKYMCSLDMRLLYVVITHMGCSCIISMAVTDTTVGITIVSILTTILLPVACYLLYQFWNHHASTEPAQPTELLMCNVDIGETDLDIRDTMALAWRNRENQGPWELEYTYGGEADLHRHFNSCAKNPGHENFIPVDQFHKNHLPEGFRRTVIVDFIRALSDLTVRVTVRYVSDRRPATYPGSGNRCENRTVVGTGWVDNVIIFGDQQEHTCKCKDCRNSSTPETHFALIKIHTAKHVVYDNLEAEHTTCHLFFDSGDTPDTCSGVVTLTGMMYRYSYSMPDACVMGHYTHDLDLGHRLRKMCTLAQDLMDTLHNRLPTIAHFLPNPNVTDKQPLSFIVSHPHGCSKHISIGRWTSVSGDGTRGFTYEYTTATCPGCTGAQVYIQHNFSSESVRFTPWPYRGTHSGTSEELPGVNYFIGLYREPHPDIMGPGREYPVLGGRSNVRRSGRIELQTTGI